ncbi:dipeptide/oligopeptide/nickel ABC transporter ATP-binding protein, partial [Streptomyces scabiei]
MALLTESALNFLGLGTTPPTASWGGLIADANLSINQQPWLIVPPGIVIALSVLSVTYLGDQMRAALRGSTPAGAPWIRTVVPQRPTLE